MWRNLSVLLLLPFLASLVAADTLIYYPVSATVTDGGTFFMGNVGRGHLVHIIISGDTPSRILNLSTSLPAQITSRAGRIWVDLNAPHTPGPFSVCFDATKTTGIEHFCLGFNVVDKPLQIKPQSDTVLVPEYGSSTLSFLVINQSLGTTEIKPSCTFPCTAKAIPIHPATVSQGDITFSYSLAGDYPATLTFTDLRSGEEYNLPITISVYPTLTGRIRSGRLLPDIALPLLYPFRLLLEVFG